MRIGVLYVGVGQFLYNHVEQDLRTGPRTPRRYSYSSLIRSWRGGCKVRLIWDEDRSSLVFMCVVHETGEGTEGIFISVSSEQFAFVQRVSDCERVPICHFTDVLPRSGLCNTAG